MTIVNVREPDHSTAHAVFAALDPLMKQGYASLRDTPDFDTADLEARLKDACAQAGGVRIEVRFKPLAVFFETRQAKYRLIRRKSLYRCDFIGLSHFQEEIA